MALLVKKMMETYTYAMNDLADTRTSDFPLIRSPVAVLFILSCYLAFVLDIGPKYMKNRKPFVVDRFMILYNIIQVICCAIQGVLILKNVWPEGFYCITVDYSENSLTMAKLGYAYFLMKLLDLMDTIFFVLRKKDKQVTFLHVYHHTLMAAMGWYALKYVAVGQIIYIGLVNSFVHAIMYGYYLLSVYDKSYKQSVWWKKHITQLQLLQFILILFWISVPLISRSTCSFPKGVSLFLLPQVMTIVALFSDFYYKTYIKKK